MTVVFLSLTDRRPVWQPELQRSQTSLEQENKPKRSMGLKMRPAAPFSRD